MSYSFPVSKPDHSGNEAKYLNEAITSGWSSSQGPFVKQFEDRFAEWVGSKYAVSCSSGTAALTIALRALGIGPGDKVVVPEFTMIATAWAVTYTGATPVFVDGDGYQPDWSSVDWEGVKAVIPVHIYGRPCSLVGIPAHVMIVEDAAEAHGALLNGKKVGTLGKIGCFSLFANKIITTGEGGMCVTDDEGLADEMRRLRAMYFNPDHTFLHPKVGYNFRMTNLQAAVGLAQLERIGEFLEKRALVQHWYERFIPSLPRPSGSVLWMYDTLLESEAKRDYVRANLAQAGVETRVLFKPMSQQPMYLGDWQKLKVNDLALRGLYLPTHTQLTKQDVYSICQKFLNAIQ
jgi:dTDP-4-amino-4,6-dideoxygalactose transaminase